MTPRERFLAAMAGDTADKVPFIIWNNKLPGEPVNSELLAAEACIINKSSVYKASHPGVKVETEQLSPQDGFARCRKIFRTGVGVLTTVERLVPGTIWLEKMLFTGPEDYDALEALIRSKAYTPCYDKFLADDRMHAEQSLARPETIYTPLQDLICRYMGVGAFCIEWADRRERLLKLCEIIASDRRKRLELVAASPAHYVIVEGNVIPEVIGRERFEEYHLGHIEEACELLHGVGKWAGAHFDANNKIVADLIGKTSLDLIESFTPPPDCNLGLKEARALWPDKTIQVNFPSSVHLEGPGMVRKAAVEILHQATPGGRFIVGVSEDISDGGVNTLVPLARAVRDHGRIPIATN